MARQLLYDDLIMDHIKNARNYRVIENADLSAAGTNPLCGDELTLFVRFDGSDHVADVSYQCTCCGITMASASLMTEHVHGLGIEDVLAITRAFRSGTDSIDAAGGSQDPVLRTVLEITKQYPARQRCAALPWETLGAMLDALPRHRENSTPG
jgi:nitrogen fixation NifU-like protein